MVSDKSQSDVDKHNKSINSQPVIKLSKPDDIETDDASEGDVVDCDDEEGQGEAGKGTDGGSNEVANNSNGRWARHEHQRFLEGLQKFGKEWKRVAAHVKTRTVVQTRTHAQKYFQKVSKSQERVRFVPDPHLPHNLEVGDDKHSIPTSLPAGMMAYPDFRHLPHGSLFFDSTGRIIRPSDLSGVNFQLGQGQRQIIPLYMTSAEGMYNPPAYNKAAAETVQRSASTEEGATLLMTSLRTSSSVPSSSIAGKRKSDDLQAELGKPANSSATLGSSIATHIEGAEALYLMNKGASIKGAAAENEDEDSPPNKRAHSYSASSAEETSLGGLPARRHLVGQQALQQPVAVPFQYYTHWDPNRRPSQDFLAKQGLAHPHLLFRSPQAQGQGQELGGQLPSHQQGHSLGGMAPSGGDMGHKVRATVGTVSEQQQFLNKVRSCIQLGDIGRLVEILNAAERSNRAGISGSSSSSSSSSSQRERSTLLKPPELQRQAKGPAASAVASSLNRQEQQQQPLSVLMEAVNLDGPDVDENTVLNMVNILILHGADVRFCDTDNCSCLHILAARGFEAVGKLLLTNGCPPDVRTRSGGDTAAHYAARHGHTGFLALLLEFGADMRARNRLSQSALDLVGYVEAVSDGPALRSEHPLRDVMRKELLLLEPRLRTLLLFHEDFFAAPSAPTPGSGTGGPSGQWDAADRLAGSLLRLRDSKEFKDYELDFCSEFDKAGREVLARVHSDEYLTFVAKMAKHQKRTAATAAAHNPSPPATVSQPESNEKSQQAKSSAAASSSPSDSTASSTSSAAAAHDDSPHPFFSACTFTAARRSAGAVVHAVDRVLMQQNRNAFCLVRPPGHNAGYNGLLDAAGGSGFSVFNNVAVGAVHALEEHSDLCQRVAIVDLDIHHGNGTEEIVRRYGKPQQLLYCSLHLLDKDDSFEMFPGTGDADDIAANIVNVPLLPLWKDPLVRLGRLGAAEEGQQLPELNGEVTVADIRRLKALLQPQGMGPQMGREAFRRALTQRLLPTLRAFNPDLILLSCGFDGCRGDVGNGRVFSEEWLGEVGGMDLEPQDFAWATAEIAKIADLCCEGRVISVLEGGYGRANRPPPPPTLEEAAAAAAGDVNISIPTSSAAAAAAAADASIDGDNSISLISPPPQQQPQKKSDQTPSTGSSGSLSVANPVSVGGLAPSHLERLAASSSMDRQSLTHCVAVHVHRLVDPYGENRLLNRAAEQVRVTPLSAAAARHEPSEREDKAPSGEEDFEDEGDDGGCETDEDPQFGGGDLKPTTS